ncbi:MAG: hypothetical protein ACMUIM_00370 [bacterium]
MLEKHLLLTDAIINLLLGVLLIFYPVPVVKFIGIPLVEKSFYVSILGAVLFGIGIALLIEKNKKGLGFNGLGLGGAIIINICGGIVLAWWILFGSLTIPLRGYLVLWFLVVILMGISLIELIACLKKRKAANRN